MPRDTDFRDSDTFKNSSFGQFRNSLFAKSSQDKATEARKNGDLIRSAAHERDAANSYEDARDYKNKQLALRAAEHDDVMFEESENQSGGGSATPCCRVM
jgi:hypothetical protein